MTMCTRVMVSLDVPTPSDGWDVIDKTGAKTFKVGLQLLYHPYGVIFCQQVAKKHVLFLDAKLSDIPTTVAKAVDQICTYIKPAFLSVRTAVPAAIEAASGRTTIVVVPTLTSDIKAVAEATPAPGIVCRPSLAKAVRALNPNAFIICPGVRLLGDVVNDHVGSTEFPRHADYIVVGRPITQASDPGAVYEAYVRAVYKTLNPE